MKSARRWFIYRRLVKELSDLPGESLSKLGTCRTAIRDFAWSCASFEVERGDSARRLRREAKRQVPQGIQSRES